MNRTLVKWYWQRESEVLEKKSVPVTTELKIWNSRGSINEDSDPLGCNALLVSKQSPTFRRGLLPPSSGCSIPVNTLRKIIQEDGLATLNVFCLSVCLCWRGPRLSLLENRVKIRFAPPMLWRCVEGERIIVLQILNFVIRWRWIPSRPGRLRSGKRALGTQRIGDLEIPKRGLYVLELMLWYPRAVAYPDFFDSCDQCHNNGGP
jgi:hypothetical protein